MGSCDHSVNYLGICQIIFHSSCTTYIPTYCMRGSDSSTSSHLCSQKPPHPGPSPKAGWFTTHCPTASLPWFQSQGPACLTLLQPQESRWVRCPVGMENPSLTFGFEALCLRQVLF